MAHTNRHTLSVRYTTPPPPPPEQTCLKQGAIGQYPYLIPKGNTPHKEANLRKHDWLRWISSKAVGTESQIQNQNYLNTQKTLDNHKELINANTLNHKIQNEPKASRNASPIYMLHNQGSRPTGKKCSVIRHRIIVHVIMFQQLLWLAEEEYTLLRRTQCINTIQCTGPLCGSKFSWASLWLSLLYSWIYILNSHRQAHYIRRSVSFMTYVGLFVIKDTACGIRNWLYFICVHVVSF